MNGAHRLRPVVTAHGALPFVGAAVVGGVAIAMLAEGVFVSPLSGLAFLAAVTIVLVSIRQLELGLFFLIAFTYGHVFEVAKGHVGLSAALPFVVFLLALTLLTRAPGEPLLGRTAERAMTAFVAYGLLLFVSSLWARDGGLTLTKVAVYGKQMLVVLVVLALVRSRSSLVLAMWAVAGSALVLGGLTLVQRLWSVDQTFFGLAKPAVHEVTAAHDLARAAGPIGNPNPYGQMLVVAVPLAVGLALCGPRTALRLLALAAAAVSVAGVYLTFSRSAAVALAIVVLLLLVRFRPRLAPVVVAAAVLALLVGAGPGFYTSRLEQVGQVLPWYDSSQDADPSISGRGAFLRIGLRMWGDNPLLGVGYANYPVRYAEYNRRVGSDPALGNTAHNFPVEVAAETGLVGLALWSFLAASALGALLTVRKRATAASREDVKALIDVLGISLLGYLVTSLFSGGAYAMLYWLLLAICFSVPRALSSATELGETDEVSRPSPLAPQPRRARRAAPP